MALIKCSECSNEVSELAAVCPKCAAPIANKGETIAAGTQIITNQETSKKFKLHTLFSVGLIIIGVIRLTALSDPSTAQQPIWAPIFIMVGLIWWIINKFRIWWHHK